jgi:hypothetical protein
VSANIEDFIALWDRFRDIKEPTRDDLVEHVAAEMRIGVPDHEPIVHHMINVLGYSSEEIGAVFTEAKARA